MLYKVVRENLNTFLELADARARASAASAKASACHAVAAAFGRSEGGWVLSVPRPIRYILARDAKLLTGALRILG